MIPLVIFHIGNQEYFQKCATLNSKYNKVYIIGDETNKNIFNDNQNIHHVNIKDLETPEIHEFKNNFINYSTNPHEYEMNCFLRIFYIKNFLSKYEYEQIFNFDNDCVIFENVNNIFTKETSINIAYSIINLCEEKDPYIMCGSVHNSLLNMSFCTKFIKLCFDIYIYKTKFHLIEPKINWHRRNNIGGGICDMTLYYLIYKEKIIDNILNTNELFVLNNEKCVFDHQLGGFYGFNGNNTYLKSDEKYSPYFDIKKIIKKDGKNYFITSDNEEIRALSIHYQGECKKFMINNIHSL